MTLLRIAAVEFGFCLLLAFSLLGSQTWRHWWKRQRRRGRGPAQAENVVLCVVAVATGAWYLHLAVRSRREPMPGISGLWLAAYGVSCMVYLVMKLVRVRKAERDAGREPEQDQGGLP